MMPSRRVRPDRRCLVFAPLAYLKLQYLCHVGPTEVGAFGISAARNPLYVTEVVTVPQLTSLTTVQFQDDAVADYFDQCVDQGLQPAQFARIWLHSHPGDSALPSGTDEETFRRVFGHTDWAIMAILSREGRSYARLRLNTGPGATCRLRWRVDWAAWSSRPPGEALPLEAWRREYEQNIHPQPLPLYYPPTISTGDPDQLQELDDWYHDPSWSPRGDWHDDFATPEGYQATWPDSP